MSAAPLALDAVEVHAEGEPGRILTSAAGLVQGDTMAERLQREPGLAAPAHAA
jgi:proline racemase